MKLSPNVVMLGVPDVDTARAFYSTAFSLAQDGGGLLDVHGAGRIALVDRETLAADAGVPSATSGFRGYTLNYTVNQPGEVEAVLSAAEQCGATVVKPLKKSLFAGVSAVFRAPDGAIWKVAAPTRKDTGPVGQPPKPTETIAILGVDAPTASRDFYSSLGMPVDRDYGNTFIDFQVTPGLCRMGLMTRKSLAKDAGVDADGTGFQAVVFNHEVETRGEVDILLAEAARAGGRVVVDAADHGQDAYAGQFADPDGFLWRVCAG